MSSVNATRAAFLHCISCEDELTSADSILVAKEYVCRECFDISIRPQFEATLLNEEAFPPTVGPIKLDIHDYAHLLSHELVAAYTNKAMEYAILPRLRVYCANNSGCNAFLGKISEITVLAVCEICDSATCLKCRRPIHKLWNETLIKTHGCEDFLDAAESIEHKLPEEMRGKDWQICPGEDCETLVTLRDGCNHVTCTLPDCSTQFCFVCSHSVTPGTSSHWNLGMPCPRYGHPDGPRPRWSAADDDEEADDEGAVGEGANEGADDDELAQTAAVHMATAAQSIRARIDTVAALLIGPAAQGNAEMQA